MAMQHRYNEPSLLGCRLLLGLVLAGCSGSSASRAPAVVTPSPAPVFPAPERVRQGDISRASLDAYIQAGLGRFLQRVDIEPHLDAGAFVGFRVKRLQSELFDGVDLREGDTVLSINRMPIERPEQAVRAWNALRVASELTVDYLRGGSPRQLRFTIVE